MDTWYKILDNKKYSLSKKCLDTLEMNIGNRIIRIDPLMSSDKIVVSKKGKYLSDFMTMLYIAMINDKRMYPSSRATSEASVLVMDRVIVLTPPNGVSLNVRIPREEVFSTDNATLVNYIFTRLWGRGYDYPLAIINSKTNVGVLQDGKKDVLYLYLTTELKLERKTYSKEVQDKIDRLVTIGDRLDVMRRKSRMDFKTFSKLLSLVRYSLLSVNGMSKTNKNLGIPVTEESINNEVVYTSVNVMSTIYHKVDMVPIIELMIKYLISYRELIRTDKDIR